MTGARKKQLKKQFCRHIHPVKTFRGDPTRPAYTLYSWWEYATFLAGMNELDELLEQWPHNQARTVALLGVQQAYEEHGAPHLAEELVRAEKRENIHGHMLDWRRMMRRIEPGRADRYAEHQALAEVALAESQRRKQGPPTGKASRRRLARARLPRVVVFTPAQLCLNNRPTTSIPSYMNQEAEQRPNPVAGERPIFGPKEATREQRQALVATANAINATQSCKSTKLADELDRRYIEGELTLAQCGEELDRYYKSRYPNHSA